MLRNIELILQELNDVFSGTNFAGEQQLLEEVIQARQIVCVGAGRVGLVASGFAKRLMHLGKAAFWFEDVTLPRTGPGDLALIVSGSGETKTISTIGDLAKDNGLRIALLTASPDSYLSRIADAKVVLNCPNPLSTTPRKISNQPMTTLFEQASQLYLDSLVLQLMSMTSTAKEDMERRHNAIE